MATNNGSASSSSASASTSARPHDATSSSQQSAAQQPARSGSVSQNQRQRPSMSSSGSSGSIPTSHMESTITRLLVATKQLLEGLAKWSRGEVGEQVISEIYVKLGNDFNVACAAFAKENIGMDELLSVPSDLRICLETCLSDTPSQATLERHLPKVRQIIIGLLHGLREKQRLYRDGAAARKVRETKEREAERDRIARMAQSGELGRSGSMSGQGGVSAVGAATAARMQMQQQSAGGSKEPLTPNSANRSRDDLRKFVTQAKASGPPPALPSQPPPAAPPNQSTSASRNTTPQPAYPTSAAPVTSHAPPIVVAEATIPPSSSSSSASSFVSTSTSGGRYDDAVPTSSKQSTRSRGPSSSEPSMHASAVPLPPTTRHPQKSASAGSTGGSLRERNSVRASLEGVHLPHSKSSSSLASSLGNLAAGVSSGRPTSGERTRAYSPPPPPREVDDPGPVPLTPTIASPAMQQQQLPPSINTAVPPTPSNGGPPPVTSPTKSTRPASVMSSHSLEEPYKPTLESSQSAAQIQSLEALKASDNLSRRASKRYSAYTIQKMTTGSSGSPLRGAGEGGSGSSRGERLGRAGDELRRGGSGSSAGRELADGERRGGALRDGAPRRTKSEFRPMRGMDGERRQAPPPLPSLPASLSTPGGLASLGSGTGLGVGTIVEQEEVSSREGTPDLRGGPPTFPPPSLPHSSPTTSTPTPATSITPTLASTVEPASQIVTAAPLPHHVPQSARSSISSPTEPSYPLSVFLQLGRDVKKAKLEAAPTHSTLRMLFVERFQYNPGASGEFPAIYVRDREAGVHYELEDLMDVREGSVLSLNIDDVQQVKQHIDQGLLALAQEMKELKTTVTAMRRVSVSANTLFSPDPSHHHHAATSSPVMRPSPSERQFQDAAQKVLRMRRLGSTNALASPDEAPLSPRSDAPPPPTALPPPPVASVPSSTSTSAPAITEPESLVSPTRSASGDAYTAQVVGTLKTQHEEVQNLRRDIGVLRQVYLDFSSQTKDMMATVRVQTSHVATLAGKKISMERKFVEAGTQRFEAESTELVMKVDDLQDAIEQIRADTLRGIRARPAQLSELGVTVTKLTKAREEMIAWVAKVKPTWATTWSEELQQVLNEQALVTTQEQLLEELSADIDDVKDVLKNIETVSKQGKGVNGGGGGGGARAARTFDFGGNDGSSGGGSEEGGGQPAFLLEVKGLRPDPARRLEAIAKAERQREMELASRTDEFADELGGFVSGAKLKKSGGIEETERLRQARSEATLKAMFAS